MTEVKMEGKRILITGGAGFIGSNIAEELAKEGDNEIIIIDNLSSGKIENIEHIKTDAESSITLVKGSITDLDFLKKSFSGVDYVFHQAAIASVQQSIDDPIASSKTNAEGTLNVLVAARDSGVKKVVCASSSAVYGDEPGLPKVETMRPYPLSPYAVTKLMGEHYCRIFTGLYDLKTVSLRYFNVYGPRQDPSSDYAAVIPKFIKSGMEGRPPVIYGDGTQTRDFVFVKDVVRANILAAESEATGVYNIASGESRKINSLAEMIRGLMNKELIPIHREAREGDIKHSWADITKAKENLGYKPIYSLEDGLRETVLSLSSSYSE